MNEFKLLQQQKKRATHTNWGGRTPFVSVFYTKKQTKTRRKQQRQWQREKCSVLGGGKKFGSRGMLNALAKGFFLLGVGGGGN